VDEIAWNSNTVGLLLLELFEKAAENLAVFLVSLC